MLENNLCRGRNNDVRDTSAKFFQLVSYCRVIDGPPIFIYRSGIRKAVVQGCSNTPRTIHRVVIRASGRGICGERLDSERLANEPRPHTRPPVISTNCSPINYAPTRTRPGTTELIRRWHYYPADCRLRYRALGPRHSDQQPFTIPASIVDSNLDHRSSLVSRGDESLDDVRLNLPLLRVLYRSIDRSMLFRFTWNHRRYNHLNLIALVRISLEGVFFYSEGII